MCMGSSEKQVQLEAKDSVDDCGGKVSCGHKEQLP